MICERLMAVGTVLTGPALHSLETRFQMAEDFDPAPGAAGFQTSTPSIISLAALYGSLESFLLCGKVCRASVEMVHVQIEA